MRKVVVADADESFRRELRGHLEHHGYYVECAADAPGAIRLGLSFEPELLVTEWELGDETTGIDVAAALARHVEGIRVVFVTGGALDELRQRCTGLEVAEFVNKPVPVEKVRELIEELDPPG